MTTKLISWVTIALVCLLAVGAFVLSYTALYDVAIRNGIPGWAAWIWPLLIDLAIVVFSIGVVRAYLKREPVSWLWFLVVVFTVATILFNLVHAAGAVDMVNVLGWPVEIKYLVAVVPPVALILAFETATGMIRQEIRRATVEATTDKLEARADRLKQELADVADKLEASRTELADIAGQIAVKREQLRVAGRQPVILLGTEADNLKGNPEQRQAYLRQMIRQMQDAGQDETDIHEAALAVFDISPKTLSRDIAALNGSVL